MKNFSDGQFKIDRFCDSDQEQFARKIVKVEDVKEFFEYLEQHDLKELARIPLLLRNLCLLWKERNRKALPKERADIFALIVETLFDHMREKQSVESLFVSDYSDELYALGRLAFEALLQGQLYFPVSQFPAGYSLIESMIEVGLIQILTMTSVMLTKSVYFIHKSLQAYLAACFLKEELLSGKVENNSLVRVESTEIISKVGVPQYS